LQVNDYFSSQEKGIELTMREAIRRKDPAMYRFAKEQGMALMALKANQSKAYWGEAKEAHTVNPKLGIEYVRNNPLLLSQVGGKVPDTAGNEYRQTMTLPDGRTMESFQKIDGKWGEWKEVNKDTASGGLAIRRQYEVILREKNPDWTDIKVKAEAEALYKADVLRDQLKIAGSKAAISEETKPSVWKDVRTEDGNIIPARKQGTKWISAKGKEVTGSVEEVSPKRPGTYLGEKFEKQMRLSDKERKEGEAKYGKTPPASLFQKVDKPTDIKNPITGSIESWKLTKDGKVIKVTK
jgi:hypothetical protein